MSRNLTIVAVVAGFFLGCSAGLVGGVLLARFAPSPRWHEASRGAPRARTPDGEAMVSRLARALDLTDSQRVRIEQVFDRAHRDHAAVRDSARAAIERELTPEQLRRWKQIESRFSHSPRGRALRPPGEGDRP